MDSRRVGLLVVVGLLLFAAPAGAAFPGVNGKIAFQHGLDGNVEVYTMEPDGSARTQLTTDPVADGDPVFSADGSRIAFAHGVFSDDADVYVMNADGSGQTRLTTNPAADHEPAFSPDGSKIAFTSTRDGNAEVYVMNADGSGQTRLTVNGAQDFGPVFSPDGSRIAFARSVAGNADIYLMDVDGTDVARLTNDGGAEPAFSPDGSQIAYTSTFIPPPPPPGSPPQRLAPDVFVMNADGSGRTQLTHNARPARTGSPAFSPDGSRIAFAVTAPNYAGLMTMNADGSDVNQLPNVNADSNPDWGVVYTPPEPPPIVPLLEIVPCPLGTSASVVCRRDRHGDLVMVGTGADETFVGTNGEDWIYAFGGDDVVKAWSGDDWVYGGRGADHIRAGGGEDHAYGGSGADTVSGGGGKDRVKGAAGADRLTGGLGRDSMNGGSGDDRLTGGSGADRMNCGPGADRARRTPLDHVARNCELR
jgi:dipeptidyl aminopeptidase/acylaminoacyl peptidase